MTATTALWYLDEAQSRYGNTTVAGIVNGDLTDYAGAAALQTYLHQEAHDDWLSRRDSDAMYGELVSNFNSVTSGWNDEPRARFASYQARELDPEDDDGAVQEYVDDLEGFAASYDVREDTREQESIDFEGPENPYDADLNPYLGEVVMMVRVNEPSVDEQHVISECEQPNNLLQRYRDTGDIEASLRAHYYDPHIDSELASSLAPPEEWPDDLDPARRVGHSCFRCGENYDEVMHESHGRTYVSDGGRPTSLHDMRSSETQYYWAEPDTNPPNNYLCDTCAGELRSSATTMKVSDGDDVARLGITEGVVIDYGLDDTDYTPYPELDDGFDVQHAPPDPQGNDLAELPVGEFDDVDPVRDQLITVAESNQPAISAPYIILNGPMPTVYLHHTDTDAAVQFQNYLLPDSEVPA
jgi:hypothetical protein